MQDYNINQLYSVSDFFYFCFTQRSAIYSSYNHGVEVGC